MKSSNRTNRRTRSQSSAATSEPLEQRRLLASILVNSVADNIISGDGLTTLREAITAANATPAVADTITFDLGAGAQTINLAGALPDVSTDMTIQGPGPNLLMIRRNTEVIYRILTIPAGNVVLQGLTITNGLAPFTSSGSGIYNAGTLTIDQCTVSGNGLAGFDSRGGGIGNDGVLTVNNSTITGNRTVWEGGGIYNVGSATFNYCTISNNSAGYNTAYGGGISSSGTLVVRNSTISANSTGRGAGIASDGSLVLENTTVSDNSAAFDRDGGGLFCRAPQGQSASITNSTFTNNSAQNGGAMSIGDGLVTIAHCTVSGNTSGLNIAGSPTISNSIIAGNSGPNISGTFTDGGYNFIGGDPKLAPLTDNGGPTKTMALLPGSTCINRGDPNFASPLDFDQRGAPFARKVGPRIDIGAFESDVLNAPPTVANIPQFTVLDYAPDAVINLRDFFEDGEDGAASLVYTVVGNTNPALFTSTSIDNATDALTLDYAEGADGLATITVRGTDSGGLFVEQTVDVTVLLSSFVVNSAAGDTTLGDGLTTLREAITAANLNADANTITFALGPGAHTINLTGALPTLLTDLTIQGAGADLLTVRRDTGGDYNVFVVGSPTLPTLPTVTIAGITITNGSGGSFGGGGGALLGDGALTINDCIITGNTGHSGAGIFAYSGTLTVNNTVISDNVAESYGGGLYIFSPITSLNNCTISGNTSGYDGGGIYNESTLNISDCTISGNTANSAGGGISNSSYGDVHLTITGSTISGNTVVGDFGYQSGGGIFLESGSMTIDNSTVSGNSAVYGGGGVSSIVGDFTISNSTIAGNTASQGGGVSSFGTTTLVNSTLSGNSATSGGGAAIEASSLILNNCTISANNASGTVNGGAVANYGTLTASNTIIAANVGGDIFNDVGATADTTDHNFIGTDHPGVDPLLGPLANNGGPTKTMALLPGSPSINAGDPNFAAPPDFDQRGAGFARVSGERVDIGAFERDSIAPVVESADFDFDAPVQALRATFSEDVSASLSLADLVLENLTTGTTVLAGNLAVSYSTATNTPSFSFPGYSTGGLPDGNYRATLLGAGVTDPSNNPMASNHVLEFFFLNGDANRDRTVDIGDFAVLASWFNRPGTFSQGDFDYNGMTDLGDFAVLASRFNTGLPALRAAGRSAAATPFAAIRVIDFSYFDGADAGPGASCASDSPSGIKEK